MNLFFICMENLFKSVSRSFSPNFLLKKVTTIKIIIDKHNSKCRDEYHNIAIMAISDGILIRPNTYHPSVKLRFQLYGIILLLAYNLNLNPFEM